MNSTDLLMIYESNLALSLQMRSCAEQEDWEKFKLLNQTLNQALLISDVETLFQSLSPNDETKVQALLQEIMGVVDGIQRSIHESMSKINQQLGNVNVQRKLEQAYSDY